MAEVEGAAVQVTVVRFASGMLVAYRSDEGPWNARDWDTQPDPVPGDPSTWSFDDGDCNWSGPPEICLPPLPEPPGPWERLVEACGAVTFPTWEWPRALAAGAFVAVPSMSFALMFVR